MMSFRDVWQVKKCLEDGDDYPFLAPIFRIPWRFEDLLPFMVYVLQYMPYRLSEYIERARKFPITFSMYYHRLMSITKNEAPLDTIWMLIDFMCSLKEADKTLLINFVPASLMWRFWEEKVPSERERQLCITCIQENCVDLPLKLVYFEPYISTHQLAQLIERYDTVQIARIFPSVIKFIKPQAASFAMINLIEEYTDWRLAIAQEEMERKYDLSHLPFLQYLFDRFNPTVLRPQWVATIIASQDPVVFKSIWRDLKGEARKQFITFCEGQIHNAKRPLFDALIESFDVAFWSPRRIKRWTLHLIKRNSNEQLERWIDVPGVDFDIKKMSHVNRGIPLMIKYAQKYGLKEHDYESYVHWAIMNDEPQLLEYMPFSWACWYLGFTDGKRPRKENIINMLELRIIYWFHQKGHKFSVLDLEKTRHNDYKYGHLLAIIKSHMFCCRLPYNSDPIASTNKYYVLMVLHECGYQRVHHKCKSDPEGRFFAITSRLTYNIFQHILFAMTGYTCEKINPSEFDSAMLALSYPNK